MQTYLLEYFGHRMAQLEPAKKKERISKYTITIDTVFKKVKFPEVIEKMIQSYTMNEKEKAFLDKYGYQNASFLGDGWISDWHPNIRSTKWDRKLWNVFTKNTCTSWGKDIKAPFVTMEHLKPLQGKEVLITYKNARGNVTKMYPKRIVSCSANQVRVSDGPDDDFVFVLNNDRMLRVDLFVDIARDFT